MYVLRGILIGTTLAAVAVPAVAVADSAVTSAGTGKYTGCLLAGSIFYVKAGDSPLRNCPRSASRITIGSGDITGVAAGFGLKGGGSTGDVTLEVDPTEVQTRVGGTCLPGSAVSAVAQDGTVTCGPGFRYSRNESADLSVDPGKSSQVVFACEVGRAVSGGAGAGQSGTDPGVITLNESYPSGDSEWTVRVTNATDSAQTYTAWVVCLA